MADAAGTVLWFRQDLRLADNPALAAAVAKGGPVTALYVLDDATPGDWRMGAASRVWLHHSLTALGAALAARGVRLVLRRGGAREVVPSVVREAGAAAVAWNRRYTPSGIACDRELKAGLEAEGVEVMSRGGGLMFEPWTVATKTGTPFKVYTPFARACRAKGEPALPEAAADDARPGSRDLPSDDLASWGLLPTNPDWSGGIMAVWKPGEAEAWRALDRFLDAAVPAYAEDRNRPDREGTSRLSPRLHWGELAPHRAWHAARRRQQEARGKTADRGVETFLNELLWREFAHHILYYFPQLPDEPLRPEFAKFPWDDDAGLMKSWRTGRTGYPIVDAGMRQLREMGWMHNRLRMIVGSFLVKDLLLPWREGERWFWEDLVDADLANNSMGWQWIAGCGVDAAPYFRIFNPVTQGQRYDPSGDYVRRFVPELAKLPTEHIHAPWEAPDAVLRGAGVTLGGSYPRPVVEHKAARARALAALAATR